MTRRATAWIITLAAAAGAAKHTPAAQPPAVGGGVVLRGPDVVDPSTPNGEPVAVSPDGVTIVVTRASDGRVTEAVMLGWDSVRRVDGPLSGSASAFKSMADRAWRGRLRLARGDHASAEPLFEALASESSGRAGPTASSIWAGLLLCRMHRGASTLAVEAWAGWLRASSGVAVLSEGEAPDVPTPRWDDGWSVVEALVDSGTKLVPRLPPIWTPGPEVKAFAEGGPKDVTPIKPAMDRGTLVLELYRAAARAEVGLSVSMPDLPAGADAGLRLIFDIVRSRLPDAAPRRDARKQLHERIGKSPAWVDAWCRVAAGRSMLLEADAEQKRRGVVMLLSLAALGETTDGPLTALALADSAAALAGLGDERGAASVAADLASRFPDHPSLMDATIKKLLSGRSARGSETTPGRPMPEPKEGGPS